MSNCIGWAKKSKKIKHTSELFDCLEVKFEEHESPDSYLYGDKLQIDYQDPLPPPFPCKKAALAIFLLCFDYKDIYSLIKCYVVTIQVSVSVMYVF